MCYNFFYSGSQTDENQQRVGLDYFFKVAIQILSRNGIIQRQPDHIEQGLFPANNLILFSGPKVQVKCLATYIKNKKLKTKQRFYSNGKFDDFFIANYFVKQLTFQGVIPFTGTNIEYASPPIFKPIHEINILIDLF